MHVRVSAKTFLKDVVWVIVVASLYTIPYLLVDSTVRWLVLGVVTGGLLLTIILRAAQAKMPRARPDRPHLPAVIARLPASMWIVDLDLRLQAILGLSPLTNFSPDFHPEKTFVEYPELLPLHEEALKGLPGTYEVNAGGRWYSVHVRPLHNQQGEITGCVGVATDVTRCRELEMQLGGYNDKLRELLNESVREFNRVMRRVEAILNSSSDSIALLREDGTIEQTNPAFDDAFGYEMDEAFGLPITFFVEEGPHVETVAGALDQVLENHEIQRAQIVALRKDGSTFDADVAFAPVEVENEPTTVVASLRDITQLKEIERFKTRFVSNAAHDLGNPIANLKLRVYLLKRSPDQLGQHLDVLEHQVCRLESLVEDLRTLAKMDRGSVSLDLKPVDLNELAGRIVSSHRSMAASKSQNLRFIPDDELPEVEADRFQLERVMVNLIANALNYTPKGGYVTVRTTQKNGTCRYIVEDNGLGINPDELPYIFERFYRSSTVKEAGLEGTGLGLAIAQEIVDAHGGRIEVESALDEGSIFTVILPRS